MGEGKKRGRKKGDAEEVNLVKKISGRRINEVKTRES